MSEQITIHPQSRGVDDDGRPLPTPPDRSVWVKSVQQVSAEELSDEDKSGSVRVLRVWCSSSDGAADSDDVTIRGLRYQVRVSAWDPAAHRRPVLSRHRPSAVFDAVRGEG
ncbi:hypothetical protein [Corynebacterium kalidii]|uniref:Head-tail adaptor protein n=1 Tax=Corynebacterium kalidii TaxID=2931982 RepID=A0A9X1WJC6_9CORY|nr:hypothetical protein [Corynebacterium kalidii]MCJ7859268.1 hypothetical protein [Corynebacterium kalidii]